MNVSANSTGTQLTSTYSWSTIAQSAVEIFFGLCAIVTNGLLLILAYKNLNLRNGAKRLQVALAFADLILGVGTIMLSMDGWRLRLWSNWMTAYYCIFIGLIKVFGDSLSLTLTLMMTVERLFAICFPMKYRSVNKRALSCSFIAFSWAVCLVFAGFSYYGVDNNIKPKGCSGGSVRIDALKPMLSYFNFVVGSTVVLLYSIVLFVLTRQRRKYRNVNTTEGQNFKREMEVTKVVTLVVLGCIVFYVIPNIVFTILSALKQNFVGGATSMFSLCNSWVDFILYVWKDKEIRSALLKFRQDFISVKTNSVTPTERRNTTTIM